MFRLGAALMSLGATGAVLLLGQPASAQVNVEPLRKQLKESGFGARVSGSLSGFAGNTQGVIFGSAGLVGMHGERQLGLVALSGDYARLNHVVSVARWFGHARYNLELNDDVWWELFGQLESDRFRRVAFRRLLGTGPRVQLFGSEPLQVFYGAAYMLEHVNLETRQAHAAGEGSAHRFSNYASITLRAHPKISVTSVTYVQPRVDRPSDVKLLNVSQSDFEITGKLHSRVDVTVRYDTTGPPDLSRTDLELKNVLELIF
jgi:hypothetical protein